MFIFMGKLKMFKNESKILNFKRQYFEADINDYVMEIYLSQDQVNYFERNIFDSRPGT